MTDNSSSPDSTYAVEQKLLSLNALWETEGGPFDGGWIDEVMALMPDTPAVAGTPSDEISQHIGWLKQYVEGMTAANWQDMRLRADRQLAQLSKDLDARGPAQPAPSKEALDWATGEASLIEQYKRANPDWLEQTKPAREVIGPAQPAVNPLDKLSDMVTAKIEQLEHYREHDCQLDHAKTVADGRISQAIQILHWIAQLSSVSSTNREAR